MELERRDFESTKWMDRKTGFEALEEAFNVATANLDAVVVARELPVQDIQGGQRVRAQERLPSYSYHCVVVRVNGGLGVMSALVPRARGREDERYKVSEMVRPMFLALAELVGLASVLAAIFGHMSVVKTPQAQFECLEFARESVGEFGMPTCNPHGVIEYVKEPFGLASSSPKTRVSAIAVFGSLYGQLGDAMRPLLNLDGWKLSLKDCVEAEFERVGFNPSSFAVSRALFGRVDVRAKISKELLADMANEHDKVAWKKRLGAMEQTQQICEKADLSIELTKG
ncbi:hypothetical protein H257_03568 [Aphanomyces astaci]|uniref:Uncharacterized protein n=1 Tax=Aphanomyces astaci TaxID=112090 RepID=W4GZH4_APHAT|nr:hypothetical protein H257_03568 [Aphanomyces astaci]ETV84328.1 hypothetical protein H257_03568 [Aphanomyces astaci]|eukprot:XP_009826020.1 hypothetical protein H257_03568 [Aphanomyces astaci]